MARLLPLGVVLGLLAACSGGSADGRTGPADRATAAPSSTDRAATPCTPAPLEDRAGAVLLVGLPGVTRADEPLAREVAGLGVGGVLLTDANVTGAGQVRALVGGLRAASPRPLVVAVDEEGGRVSSIGAVAPRGPSARRLGAAGPEAARAAGRALGVTLHGLDVDVALAPVADLDDGPAGGVIGDRSFGDDPSAVAAAVVAFADGLRDAGVAATAKHFPGYAGAGDSHAGPAAVDRGVDDLRRRDLVPFTALVREGVPLVLLSHVAYAGLGDLPASLNPAAYRLLRETGFEGAAITDSLGMGAVNLRWPFPEAAVRALVAGADGALATDGAQARAMRDEVVAAVRAGRLPEARLDEAVTRMARLGGGDPAPLVCP